MSKRGTLIGQTILVNVFLVTAVLFGATSAANLNLRISSERLQFALLAMAIMLALLANIMMLRRRFSPLEQLIDRLEAIDPAQGVSFDQPMPGEMEEVDRLSATFKRLLERIESERRRSGRLVLRAQEEERKRVARDLHDEVNQALTAILLRLQALMQDAPSPEVERELSQLKRLVVYRVAQEALANVARHAGATRVEVDLTTRNGGIDLCVRDDGRGFDATLPPSGLGLEGMAERARLVGGELSVYSSAGRGTTVTLHVP